jgi:hypothetical protein
MEFLLINPKELPISSIMGGNIDIDKYRYAVSEVQVNVIEPLLGTELYDKILEDAEANTLSGLYLELYSKFLKHIIKYESIASYIEVAPYLVTNGGVFKNAPADKEIVSSSEVGILASRNHSKAQVYVQRFEKWICKNTLPEYKRWQDEVNAQNVKTSVGWYL